MHKLAPVLLVLLMPACDDGAPLRPDAAPSVPPAYLQRTGGAVFFQGTGGYYEAIEAPGITWSEAAAAAESLRVRSCIGHLATLTSQAENDFVTSTFPEAATGGYWLGGAQGPGFPEPGGGWAWVTGEPFLFANWNVGEPDDQPCGSCNADRIRFAGPTADPSYATYWSDVWGDESEEVGGYVVEYDCGPDGRVTERVTGSGHFTVDGKLRTFSFNARRYADGSVDGEYQFYNRATGGRWHGNVTCLEIRGDRAWLGGRAETGEFTPPNDRAGWTVVDGGEGARAAGDRITLQWTAGGPGFASAYCAAAPVEGDLYGLPLNDVEAGNIRIHGR